MLLLIREDSLLPDTLVIYQVLNLMFLKWEKVEVLSIMKPKICRSDRYNKYLELNKAIQFLIRSLKRDISYYWILRLHKA